MKRSSFTADMAVVVALAMAIGLAWNHTLLYNAWTGKAVKSVGTPVAAGKPAALLPLPAGLMQVKDFYDRGEALFIDARDRTGYNGGHIKGAISLPAGEVEKELDGFLRRVSLTTMLVLYCNGYDCHDSATLAEKLLKAGYRTVFVFEGGYPEWRDARYPLDTGAP